MKKAYASVIGIIFALSMLLIPFTGAFADSDPGISIAVLNSTFNWYTGFPGANENGWLGSTQFPVVSAVCNGETQYTGLTGYIDLLQDGDYVDYGQNIDTLSSYNTPIWCAEFLIDQAYDFNIDAAIIEVYNLLGGYEYPTDVVYQYYSPDYTIDGNTHYAIYRVFFQTNDQPGYLHFRFSYNPADIYGSRFQLHGIRLRGYIGDPSSPGYQTQLLQNFNLARLADLIQLDSSDIDLSTLEATTNSILQKLANVPDIYTVLSHIDTTDTQILAGIDTLISFINRTYTVFSSYHRVNTLLGGIYIDRAFNFQFNDLYIYVPLNSQTLHSMFDFCLFVGNDICSIDYAFAGNFDSTINNISYFDRFDWITPDDLDIINSQNNANNFELHYYHFAVPVNMTTGVNLIIHLKSNTYSAMYEGSINYYNKVNYQSFYDYVLYYLRILTGVNSTVPSGIQQTTDTVTEQVTDIVEFEDNYNQSLESSASQIDVSSYEIQQTQGMSFMRTYTELNFDRMQNFRILFLTPLILALASFFLRRKT